MKDINKILEFFSNPIDEAMGGELDQKLFIKISPRSSAKAYETYKNNGYINIDQNDSRHITRYGSKFKSDVYASNSIEDIYDFYYDLVADGVEVEDENVTFFDFDIDNPIGEIGEIKAKPGGVIDEPYFIELDTEHGNPIEALTLFTDEFANKNNKVTFYPGNVYASYDYASILDLFNFFSDNGLSFYTNYDFEKGPVDGNWNPDDDREDYRLDEDAFKDTYKDNVKRARKFLDNLKGAYDPNREKVEAYLKIKDKFDANKYWNDRGLATITQNVYNIKEIVKATLLEKKKKRDRCLRIADRKFDEPSAYKSAAAVRCRQGEIWKGLKEELIKEKAKETLRTWFSRQGAPGKTSGWVDCNSPIYKDGKKKGYKPCGRAKGEKRTKYPSCRPTAAKCSDPGKGTKWGKTK
jgi:hypothetical protein